MNREDFKKEVSENYEWFKKERKNIIAKHKDKINFFALIKDKKIVGFYSNYEKAILDANTKFPDQPFSIQKLEEKEKVNHLGFIGLQWAR